ncbi:hypothetical protein [Paenibacillus sonchi]|uniref:hypothetical protein n=1 Tax=Paenibacillus sonchi TaxID=373687 RepID=UPI001E369C0D|nr:hypothetical protein [Paenibacillus sonchi]MCE3203953.1 hypothetical protein [Paenibacillus sonchi]
MITLEAVPDPMSAESVELQAAILNSQPAFNLMVQHKELLTPEEIREETAMSFVKRTQDQRGNEVDV